MKFISNKYNKYTYLLLYGLETAIVLVSNHPSEYTVNLENILCNEYYILLLNCIEYSKKKWHKIIIKGIHRQIDKN